MVDSAPRRSEEAEEGKPQRCPLRQTQRRPLQRAAKPGSGEPARRKGIRGEEPPNQARMNQLNAKASTAKSLRTRLE